MLTKFEKNFNFFEKCKQTAEISWLFISNVKIQKNYEKQNFGICYPDVKTYLDLFSPTAQKPKIFIPISILCISRHLGTKNNAKAIFLYVGLLSLFHDIMKKNWHKILWHYAKVGDMSQKSKKSKKFYCDTDHFIKVAGETYNL